MLKSVLGQDYNLYWVMILTPHFVSFTINQWSHVPKVHYYMISLTNQTTLIMRYNELNKWQILLPKKTCRQHSNTQHTQQANHAKRKHKTFYIKWVRVWKTINEDLWGNYQVLKVRPGIQIYNTIWNIRWIMDINTLEITYFCGWLKAGMNNENSNNMLIMHAR